MIEKTNWKELSREIGQILREEWDPIGVTGIPEACDEYESYVADLMRLIAKGASQKDILNFLWWVETTHMGLVGNREKTEQIAEKLASLQKPSPQQ